MPEDVRAVHLFGLEEVISLCSDIASGLAFLHANNLLHLDLKAENILLNRNHEDLSLLPVAMLSDFGSAEARNAVARKLRSGTTGTLDYLAPEAFQTLPNGRSRPHTAELDLWALGLVMHVIVFYELPYLEVDVDRKGFLGLWSCSRLTDAFEQA
jgi:serine/threonine protein kinase